MGPARLCPLAASDPGTRYSGRYDVHILLLGHLKKPGSVTTQGVTITRTTPSSAQAGLGSHARGLCGKQAADHRGLTGVESMRLGFSCFGEKIHLSDGRAWTHPGVGPT